MAHDVAQGLLHDTQDRDLERGGHLGRQLGDEDDVQTVVLGGPGQAPQRGLQAVVAQGAGALPGHQGPGLGQVVAGHGLDLGEQSVQGPGLTGVAARVLGEIVESRLGEVDHGDEPLRQGVVDLARPALVLGGDARSALGDDELVLSAGQCRERPLLVGQGVDGLIADDVDPGDPGARHQDDDDHDDGVDPPRLIASEVPGSGEARPEDEVPDDGGPPLGVDPPDHRQHDEEAQQCQLGVGHQRQAGGGHRPGQDAPDPTGQIGPIERRVQACGAVRALAGQAQLPAQVTRPGHQILRLRGHLSTVSRRVMTTAATTPPTSQAATTARPLPVSQAPVGSTAAAEAGRKASRMSSADQRTGRIEKPWTIQAGSWDRGRKRPETN